MLLVHPQPAAPVGGGTGRAPSSNSTGVSRNWVMAARTASRSALSSPSVELIKTRTR